MILSHIERNGKWPLPVSEQVLRRALRTGLNPTAVDLAFVQHLLPDTACYLKILKSLGFNVAAVYGIDYSSRSDVDSSIRDLEIDTHILPYRDLPQALTRLLEGRRPSASDSPFHPLVLQDVGGYGAQLIQLNPRLIEDTCIGIVEETRQGLWQYAAIEGLTFPVMEIASTSLKRIEATYVGEAVARALEVDLLEVGRTLSGVPITVLGFGDVGSGCARALRSRGGIVAVYDCNPTRVVDAVAAGFYVLNRSSAIRHGKIIVGASGRQSLAFEEIPDLGPSTILVSASSKQVEFPIDEILLKAGKIVEITPRLKKIRVQGCDVVVANNGFPVNFEYVSLPAFISDLLFCQVSTAICKAIAGELRPGLQTLGAKEQQEISQLWLGCYFPSLDDKISGRVPS